jgi:hypothetical protein
MRMTRTTIAILAALAGANRATGHGFSLNATSVNGSGTPTAIGATSESPFLDQGAVTAGPANLFLDQFSGIPSVGPSGTYYPTDEGFAAQTWGSQPAYTATYNVLTPLYFADGVGNGAAPAVAMPAPKGTYVDIYDLYVGDPGHPGASAGDVFVNGTNSFYPGPGVSLLDFHELEKDLYIGSGPPYGEYGFAFNVTVRFAGGLTVTTGPLIDAFAVSDNNLGNFAANAPTAQQDAATLAIYKAGMADVSFDGIVNAQDIAVVASHWLQTGSIGQLPGDANRDGIVNAQDIALIASNWEGISGGGAGAAAAVPEPATIVLVVVGTLALVAWRRRRS